MMSPRFQSIQTDNQSMFKLNTNTRKINMKITSEPSFYLWIYYIQ